MPSLFEMMMGGSPNVSQVDPSDPTGAYLGNMIDPNTAAQYQSALNQQRLLNFSAALGQASAPQVGKPVTFGGAMSAALGAVANVPDQFTGTTLKAAQTANQIADSTFKKLQGLGLVQKMGFTNEYVQGLRDRANDMNNAAGGGQAGSAPGQAGGQPGQGQQGQGGGTVGAPQSLSGKLDLSTPNGLVAKFESGGNYNIGFGGADLSGAKVDDYGFPIWDGKQGPAGISHAAGAYQFEPKTWRAYAGPLGIHDFSPESQDKVFAAAFNAEGFKPWAPYNSNIAAGLQRGLGQGPLSFASSGSQGQGSGGSQAQTQAQTPEAGGADEGGGQGNATIVAQNGKSYSLTPDQSDQYYGIKNFRQQQQYLAGLNNAPQAPAAPASVGSSLMASQAPLLAAQGAGSPAGGILAQLAQGANPQAPQPIPAASPAAPQPNLMPAGPAPGIAPGAPPAPGGATGPQPMPGVMSRLAQAMPSQGVPQPMGGAPGPAPSPGGPSPGSLLPPTAFLPPGMTQQKLNRDAYLAGLGAVAGLPVPPDIQEWAKFAPQAALTQMQQYYRQGYEAGFAGVKQGNVNAANNNLGPTGNPKMTTTTVNIPGQGPTDILAPEPVIRQGPDAVLAWTRGQTSMPGPMASPSPPPNLVPGGQPTPAAPGAPAGAPGVPGPAPAAPQGATFGRPTGETEMQKGTGANGETMERPVSKLTGQPTGPWQITSPGVGGIKVPMVPAGVAGEGFTEDKIVPAQGGTGPNNIGGPPVTMPALNKIRPQSLTAAADASKVSDRIDTAADKLNGTMADIQKGKQLQLDVASVLSRYQSGGFGTNIADFKNALKTVMPGLDVSQVNSPADAQKLIHDNVGITLATTKTNLAGAGQRILRTEFDKIGQSNQSPDLPPAANFHITVKNLAPIMQMESFLKSYAAARASANNGLLSPDDYAQKWFDANPITGFEDWVAGSIPRGAGMENTEYATELPHFSSPQELQKAGFTSGMHFVDPSGTIRTMK